jgi:trehalose 6-phosphate phosphatase
MAFPNAEMLTPLPRGKLAQLAISTGLILALDYDGTLAEITAEPDRAFPYGDSRDSLIRIISEGRKILPAVITGRPLEAVRRLLGISRGLFFSGVHGLQFAEPDGTTRFSSEALACASGVEKVRQWLRRNVPDNRGFRIEDKGVTVGLHYRLAAPDEAERLAGELRRFVVTNTPTLKLMQLKMLLEAMPRVASKGHAIATLKQFAPPGCVIAYFGDDRTDEDAFAALALGDIGVLVGPQRETLARYRLSDPAAVADELRHLADALEL